MTALRQITSLVVASVLTASCGWCGGSSRVAHEDADDPRETQAVRAEPHEADGRLRIRPEMLRDLRLTTAQVEVRTGAQTISALGQFRVNEDEYAEVGASVSGRVVQLIGRLGQAVRAGQTLAVVQSPELGRAHAELQSARARLALARQTLGRKRELAAERIAPLREVQEAEAEAHAAEAGLSAAQASLSALGFEDATDEGQPSHYRLRAPIAGTIIARDIVLGQMVDSSKSYFEIADLGSLWLIVRAFERDAVRVTVGAPSRVSLPALPGQTFSGRVALIGRQVEGESGTVPIRIDLANPQAVLRPGMTASADIQVGAEQTTILSVPAAALHRLADNWVVFVPTATAEFEIRIVGRGRDLGREVEVVRGLKAAETVVVDGAFVLKAEAEKLRGGRGADDH